MYYYGGKSTDKIKKDFTNFQRTNNFGNKIFKFGTLIHCYKMSIYTQRYKTPNKNLEKALKVKNVRENSGVTVFSIFTSGYPSYTRINPDGTRTIVKDFPDDNSGNAGKYSCKYIHHK